MTLIGFYSLHRYFESRQSKFILFYILCFYFVYLLGFRTLLVAYFISSVFIMFFSKRSLSFKISTLFISGMFVGLAWFYLGLGGYVNDAIELSQVQMAQQDEYIRFKTFRFLFHNVNVNYITIVFGNGMPIEGTMYGQLVLGYGAAKHGFIAADLGMVGFSFNFGMLSAFSYYLIIIVSAIFALKTRRLYLFSFFLYLIMCSLTTAEMFRAGMFGVVCIAIYLSTYPSKNIRSELL